MTTTKDNLESKLSNVPLLPAIVIDAYHALQNEDLTITEVEQQVGRDPALAARVLRIANSPFYGLSGKIESLKDACTILGIHTIRNIVLSAGIINHLKSIEKSQNLDVTTFWQHAFGTAVAAKVLAKHARLNPDTAFTIGLLHDIGEIILHMYFHDDYKRVKEYQESNDCESQEAENAILGFDHALVGSMVTRQWSLPESISVAIQDHHSLDKQTSIEARLIYLANCINFSLEAGVTDQFPLSIDNAILESLKMDEADIQQSLEEIKQQPSDYLTD